MNDAQRLNRVGLLHTEAGVRLVAEAAAGRAVIHCRWCDTQLLPSGSGVLCFRCDSVRDHAPETT